MAAFEYKYKMPGVHKVSAQIAGEVCDQLLRSTGGLTPQRLVDVSRDENAPMHNEFEWDDSIAGEKYREEQARKVIQHLVVVTSDIDTERKVRLVKETHEETEQKEVKETYEDRSFVSTGERTANYVPLSWALTNEQWKASLLESARRDMRAFIAKYHRLEELAKVIDDMNDILGA